jgi:hypothetical protein
MAAACSRQVSHDSLYPRQICVFVLLHAVMVEDEVGVGVGVTVGSVVACAMGMRKTKIQPSWGPKGGRPQRCVEHRLPSHVNLQVPFFFL